MGYSDERDDACIAVVLADHVAADESETLLPRLVAGPPPSVPARRRAVSASLRAMR